MAARTEAEVRRLVGELVGRKLVAARLLTVERLRGILGGGDPHGSVARLAADGLLAVATDGSQPRELRVRALDAVHEQVGQAMLRQWAHDWPPGWTERFLAIAADRGLPEVGRRLAARALEARVLEEPGIEGALTFVLAAELSFAGNTTALRLACLDTLAQTHRSNPDWLAQLRRTKRIEGPRLPAWAEWRALSEEQRALVAVLVDPSELERSIANLEEGAETDALEAVELQLRHDASSARALSVLVRRLIPVPRVVERGASSVVVGHLAEQRHAGLVRAAVAYDRARGELDLSWVEPALVEAIVAAAPLALELESEPRFDAHVKLWTDLFRDGGDGLASRLLDIVRSSGSFDSPMPAACVAVHALGEAGHERREEVTRRALDAVRRAEGASRSGTVRAAVLAAMVAPHHVFELQEARVLASIDVPTDDEHTRLYHDDPSALARRIRLSRLADVLAHGTDVERIGTALLVLPHVVRWLPCEIARFEPLVRRHFGSARPLRAQRPGTRRPPGAADPGSVGQRAFDVYLRCLVELRLVREERRPNAVVEHVAAQLADVAREALVHGHSGKALANVAKEILSPAQTAAARAWWLRVFLDRSEDGARRLDAHAALELLAGPDGSKLSDAVEEVLTREDEPELGAFLAEAFERAEPARFDALRRSGRLRIGLPPVERLFGIGHDDQSRRADLLLLEDRCRAVAAAISAEHVVATIERGEPVARVLSAIHLARFTLVDRHADPDLLGRARAALALRTSDRRTYETTVDGQRERFSVAPAAFGAYMRVLGAEPSASPEVAVAALTSALDRADVTVGDDGVPDLADTHEIARRFAEAASETIKRAAVSALEARLRRLFHSRTRNVEALEAVLALHGETIAHAGGAAAATRFRERLERVLVGDEPGTAGARYCAFRLLSAAPGVDRAALLDSATGIFMDETTDGALRTLIGSVITIWKPDAFEDVVDMNRQPWVVRRPEHLALPASSLPGNMPASWLVAVLRMAAHDDPHHRATRELVARLAPAKIWEWRRVPARWRELVGAHAEEVRRGLRSVLERPEPKHMNGRHADAARLLALFGEDDDGPLLAGVAGTLWTDREPPLEPVFWRPAGKSPALGAYSFLELYLELAFGSERRYRILSEAYALAAERADAEGEGGTASRYAYEAFLLAPDSTRAMSVLERFNR